MFVRCLFPAALFNKPTGRKFYISTRKRILRHSGVNSQKLLSCFLPNNRIHKETAGTPNFGRKRQLGISDFTYCFTDIGKSCPAQFIYRFVEVSVRKFEGGRFLQPVSNMSYYILAFFFGLEYAVTICKTAIRL